MFVDTAPAPVICAAWASPAAGALVLVNVCEDACTIALAALRIEAAMAPSSGIAEVVLSHDEAGAVPAAGCIPAVMRAPA